MTRAARRFAAIEESATFAVLHAVHRLRAQGVSVVDLGGGEPCFGTADHVVAAAVTALNSGFTHYTPSGGLAELRRAIAAKLGSDNDVLVDPDTEVIVTPSAKHAVFIAMLAMLDPGDDVIIPAPHWVSYPAMAHMVGARPVAVSTTPDFRITRQALEAHLTPATRAIVINSPCNPTGRALTEAEARDVASFAADHDLIIITDEIYEKILYAGRHRSLASLPAAAGRTLTTNGLSKAYAMTGWRIGYVAGPAALLADVAKAQQHTVGCAGSFTQVGAIAALTGPQDHVAAMTAEYAARAELIVEGLNALPGITCAMPDGAFYAFPDISGTGFADSAEFATWLLREAKVAVTPGSAFGPGGEGHVRLSFATSPEALEDALARMATALTGTNHLTARFSG